MGGIMVSQAAAAMDYSALRIRLPLGIDSFAGLRAHGCIYVDKTAMVSALASKPGAKVFLARPRRFGKSLLVSTFASLFEHGLRDFRGLAVEKLWKEEKTCPVIRLDFSKIKTFQNAEQFLLKLKSHILGAFQAAGFTYEEERPLEFMDRLSLWLQSRPENSLVLLIDEYDAPLTACISDPALFSAVRAVLQPFYSCVKSGNGAWRFVFVTGITKFNQAGIFSELSQFTDISLKEEFATLLGYTAEEIRRDFADLVSCAAEKLGASEERVLQEIEQHYGGYCFDGLSGTPGRIPVRVHAPWSVLNFLSDIASGFENYWVASGGQISQLTKYLRASSILRPEEYAREQKLSFAELSASCGRSAVSDIVLLTQTGYFTVKRRDGDTLCVGYPNQEVAQSMVSLYTGPLLENRSLASVGLGSRALCEDLVRGNLDGLAKKLNGAFLAINCKRYPIARESVCQSCTQMFLIGAGVFAKTEAENALGRSDIEFDAGDLHWVLELKFLKKGDSKERAAVLLEEAKDQALSRLYGGEAQGKIVRAGLVFSEDARQFVLWGKVLENCMTSA